MLPRLRMSRFKRPDYDDIHGFVERVEDVLLSESSWSTSDSDCSGCLHLSKESLAATIAPPAWDNKEAERAPLVAPTATGSSGGSRAWRPCRASTARPEVRSVGDLRQRTAKRNATSTLGSDRLVRDGTSRSLATTTASDRPSFIRVPCSDNSTVRHTGRMLQQRALLAAGAQPWNKNICASQGNRFAYAATLVIYVYEVSTNLVTCLLIEIYIFIYECVKNTILILPFLILILIYIANIAE